MALQVIGGNQGWLSTTHSWPSAIARLRTQAFQLEQPCHAMLAAALSKVTHIQCQLAVAINTTALEPCLLEQAQQPLVVLGPRTLRCRLPRIVATGVQLHYLAHAPHAVLLLMALDKCVPHPDCLAKYAAAFFRMSRSSCSLLEFLSQSEVEVGEL